MSKFTVVYDACVLYPAPLRDLLMQLATTRLFRAKWTADIHAEWIEAVLRDRNDLTREQLMRTRDLMNEHAHDCLVEGYEDLIPTIELPDPSDRHVVAAAIKGHADAIVTYNLRDFPPDALTKYDLDALHPDDFVNYQFDLDEAGFLVSVQKCRARLKRPVKTADEYLETLRKQQLPKTVAILRKFVKVI